ncbi:MAG TPA: hypothetical protein VF173_22250 [Thermoanaerobaculia bacterium]|nr:hypothetical protein [Thermoanaerobaculia bacterium]
MPPKRGGPGRPTKDDKEAVREVWRLRRDNPRIGYREAARRYFQEHPERLGKTTLESAARRVGGKAARWTAIAKPSERERLRRLEDYLLMGLATVQGILKRWDKFAKRGPEKEEGE